jgi:hypothetical protein
MNKDQFIYWLKGFTKAVNEEGPTRGQWGIIASELSKIEDCPNFGSPIESPVPNRYLSGSISDYTNALDRYNNWYWTLSLPKNPTTGSNQLELDLD